MDFLLAYNNNLDNPAGIGPAADWVISGGDLAPDDGLQSAVIISLFTDRLAAADDELPDDSGDRRGWWGDSLDPGDNIGSRLWLLSRRKQTQQTLNDAIGYAREALAWMIEDGVAQQIDVQAEWAGLGILKMRIDIYRRGANGQITKTQFDAVWTATLNPAPPAPLPPPTPPVPLWDQGLNWDDPELKWS